jgi:hypothetical protein
MASITVSRATVKNGEMTPAEYRGEELLDVLRNEVWPLLPDRSPITKTERELALGYDPTTGV